MVPFTPRLIPAILPNLAHHVSMIQNAANRTNKLLFSVIQNLPIAQDAALSPGASVKSGGDKMPTAKFPRSPTPTISSPSGRQSALSNQITRDVSSADSSQDGQQLQRSRSGTVTDTSTPRPSQLAEVASSNPDASRSHSPAASVHSQGGTNLSHPNSQQQLQEEPADPFDYQAAVNELTIQFISEFEETRVSALKWLIMLHQKVPKKVRVPGTKYSILRFRRF